MRQARARERIGQSATVRAACGLCLMLVTLMLVACGGQSGPSGSGSPVAASVAPAAQLTHPVRVDGGRISGLGEDTLRVFRGIPYAAPPVGDLRWRPPQPVHPWTGVRKCTAFGASCPQGDPVAENEAVVDSQSEDCLYLNVWTPARAAKERLPVMVWIHGGGFVSGSGSLPAMYGERLSGQEHVVVVSLNYRLGVFGFFAHPELSEESAYGV